MSPLAGWMCSGILAGISDGVTQWDLWDLWITMLVWHHAASLRGGYSWMVVAAMAEVVVGETVDELGMDFLLPSSNRSDHISIIGQ